MDNNGIVILEVHDLSGFFGELKEVRVEHVEKEKVDRETLDDLAHRLDTPADKMIERFIDDEEFGQQILKALSRFSTDLVSGFVSFLDKCLDETWIRSEPDGAFEGYNQNLNLILDILTTFPVKQFPPALFQTAVYALNRVGQMVGDKPHEIGKSWAATQTWRVRSQELTEDMIGEVTNVATQHGYWHLKRLIKMVDGS